MRSELSTTLMETWKKLQFNGMTVSIQSSQPFMSFNNGVLTSTTQTILTVNSLLMPLVTVKF
jgi:hypothetical protein